MPILKRPVTLERGVHLLVELHPKSPATPGSNFRIRALTTAFRLVIAVSVILVPQFVMADDSPTRSLLDDPFKKPATESILVAQSEDSYDPFADYSEFEESVDEEEDLNFFRNGRMLTLGFIGGVRGWTQNMSKLYSSNITFGLFVCYFFDLRFALQFGFLTSDHTLAVSGNGFDPIRGNVNITDLNFNLKHYFNTQNVTRGLADLNPYILGGFSQVYRTTTISGNANFGKDSAFGFNAGGGIEIPMMRNKMFFGIQGMFQYLMFTDENKVILDGNDVSTGYLLNGDSWTGLAVLGINF